MAFDIGDKGWTGLDTISFCLKIVLLAMSVCFSFLRLVHHDSVHTDDFSFTIHEKRLTNIDIQFSLDSSFIRLSF